MSSANELSSSLSPRLRRCMSMGPEGGIGDWTVRKLKKCELILYAAFQFCHSVGLKNEDATTQEALSRKGANFMENPTACYLSTNINNGEQRNTFIGLMSRNVPLTDDRISDSDTDPTIPFYYMPWVMGAVIYLLGLLFLFHWIG